MGHSTDRSLLAAVDLHGAGIRERFTEAEVESMWAIELDLGDGDGFFGCDEYVEAKEFLPGKDPSSIRPTLLDKLHRKMRGLCGGPPRQALMTEAARQALFNILKVDDDSKVLVLVDEESADVGQAFLSAASALGANVKRHRVTPEGGVQQTGAFLSLMFALSWADLIIDLSPTLEPGLNYGAIRNSEDRYVPGRALSAGMLVHGAMKASYPAMRSRAAHLKRAFEGAVAVHITTEAGTDLTIDVAGRRMIDDIDHTHEGTINIPSGEVFLAPIEHTAHGVLVADISAYGIGRIQRPLVIDIAEGRCVGITSDAPAPAERLSALLAIDDNADVMAELGIGVNDRSVLTGTIVEDEKALGTAHIAFGHNAHFPRGQNRSRVHIDIVFDKPTIEIMYDDGSKRCVLEEGLLR